MTPKDLQDRTKAFALRILKLAEALEKNPIGNLSVDKFFVRQPRLLQIIARLVEQNQQEILLPS